jgi:Protein of unknown function (DUF5132)
MRFSPLSFVLGIAVASLAPVISRIFRPLAVEATAAGMGILEDARRIVAEQMETVEDIVAEARARREHLDAESVAASLEQMAEDDETTDEPATSGRGRRRATNGAHRRRP